MPNEEDVRELDDMTPHDDDGGDDDSSDRMTTTTERNKRDFKLTSESERIQNELLAILKPPGLAPSTQKRAIVQYYINRVLKVDDVEQTVDLDFYLKVNWVDERWIGVSDDDFQDDESRFAQGWWEPGVEVINAVELEKLTDHDEAFWVEFPEHGIMAYTQRYLGSISANMDLHRFPFDTQVVPIVFESFHWKLDDMVLFAAPRQARQRPPAKKGDPWPALSSNVKLNEWEVLGIDTIEKETYYDFEDRSYSQILVNITLKRIYNYYLIRVIAMLILIIIMSWAALFMPTTDFADRVNIQVTLFLAAVAFNFVISTSLPRISYNTMLDHYIYVCYVYIVAVIVETVIVHKVTDVDAAAASLIDFVCLCVFPISFFLYNVIFLSVAVWGSDHHTILAAPVNTRKQAAEAPAGYESSRAALNAKRQSTALGAGGR